MGMFSDWIYYDKTTGTKTMTTGQKNTIHSAYSRYAKRIFREHKARYGNVFKSPDRTVEVRFSTGGFVNSDEINSTAVWKKYNVDFSHEQRVKIAKKAATLLRKSGYKVNLINDYGDIEIYKK